MRLLTVALIAVSALAVVPLAAAQSVYLERAERQRIIALVQNDERIRATLRGAEVKIGDVLPWSGDGTRATLIGGGTTLEFESPQDVEADWPLLDFPDNPNEYVITTVHYRVEGADAIDAWVDLRKDRVVSFDYLGGEVDPSSIRFVDPSTPSHGSRAGEGMSGLGVGVYALLGVAVLFAALATGRVVIRRRTSRSG